MVHQIRQRRIDGARLRAPLHGERALEHENVLLSAGWLQFRPVVDSVEQHVLRPSDLAGGPHGVPKPSWLIRIVLQDDEPAPRASHGTASFTKLQSQKLALGGRWEGNVAPCISDVRTERSGLSTCGYRRRDVNSRPLVLQSFCQKAEWNLMLTFVIEHILLFVTINVLSAFFISVSPDALNRNEVETRDNQRTLHARE